MDLVKSPPPHAHRVTEEKQRLVELLYGFGHTLNQVALALEISDDTLKKYYSRELEMAKMRIDSLAYNGIIKKLEIGNLDAIKFYLARRCGWKETVDMPLGNLPPVILNINYGDSTKTFCSQPLPAPVIIENEPQNNQP